MKNLLRLCAAVVLTLALTMSASAGQMPCDGLADSPPPSAAGQIQTTVADGEMTTTIEGQMPTLNNVASPVDPVTQMALNWWHSVLSLF